MRSSGKMAPFHGVVLALLGTLYLLLYAESSLSADSVAEPNPADRSVGKEDNTEQESEKTHFSKDSPKNVTVVVGQSAVLQCNVENLQKRTVSWMRKRDLHILTSMATTYTSDARFTVIHPVDSNDWHLRIDYVQPRDSGIYECQVNTEPKIHMAINLSVLNVRAKIWGPDDVYVKKGSTISLTCTVDAGNVLPSNVTWYHAGSIIDFDSPRGGVSLETEKTKSGTTSKLLVTRALLSDSGNYTCASNKAAPASIAVHVLNGEHPAAMQHGGSGQVTSRLLLVLLTVLNLLMERMLR